MFLEALQNYLDFFKKTCVYLGFEGAELQLSMLSVFDFISALDIEFFLTWVIYGMLNYNSLEIKERLLAWSNQTES